LIGVVADCKEIGLEETDGFWRSSDVCCGGYEGRLLGTEVMPF